MPLLLRVHKGMVIPCHSHLSPLLENSIGTTFSILLFYTQIHFLHRNGWCTCDIHMLCAQRHSFPSASLKGSCSSNVQRLTLTVLWCWKLDRTLNLGRSSLGGKGLPRDSVTVLLSPGLSPISKAPHSPTLKPFFQLQWFHTFGPGFIEDPFLYFLLPEEQAMPPFLSQNYWQLDILPFTHSSEVIWIAKAFSLLFSLTLSI